jgi:hypothetical protein
MQLRPLPGEKHGTAQTITCESAARNSQYGRFEFRDECAIETVAKWN